MFMSKGGGGGEGRFVIIFIYKGREVDFVTKDTWQQLEKLYICITLFILWHSVLRLSGKGGKNTFEIHDAVGNNASDGGWFLCLPIRGVQTGSAPVIRGFACLACKCYTVFGVNHRFSIGGRNNSGLDKIEESWEITGYTGGHAINYSRYAKQNKVNRSRKIKCRITRV